MAKTITFIARKQVEAQDVEGNDVVFKRNWSREELVEKAANNDPALFAVSESHAMNVLIPQNKYQEVYSDILEEALLYTADDEDNDADA